LEGSGSRDEVFKDGDVRGRWSEEVDVQVR
jgi:hypothetical protein